MNAQDFLSPPHVEVQRADPVHPRMAYPQENLRYDVAVRAELAPLPPQQTADYGMGRDVMHATPTMWRYQSLAIPEYAIDGIIGWPFSVAKVPSALVVSMPSGHQNAIGTRANIASPQQVSLGEQTSHPGARTWSPNLIKIA